MSDSPDLVAAAKYYRKMAAGIDRRLEVMCAVERAMTGHVERLVSERDQWTALAAEVVDYLELGTAAAGDVAMF